MEKDKTPEVTIDNKDIYDGKYMEWTTLSLSQLSFVNNIFLTIAIALLGYIVHICKDSINYNLLYILDAVLIIISIFYGFLVLLTRLYDFRITRHLVLVRDWAESRNLTHILPKNTNLRNYTIWNRLIAFITIVFVKIDFVVREDIVEKNIEDVTCKIMELQKLTNILGSATWRWLKIQILFFVLSILVLGWVLIFI